MEEKSTENIKQENCFDEIVSSHENKIKELIFRKSELQNVSIIYRNVRLHLF